MAQNLFQRFAYMFSQIYTVPLFRENALFRNYVSISTRHLEHVIWVPKQKISHFDDKINEIGPSTGL